MTFTLRAFSDADRTACADILASMPEWFGIDEANVRYVANLHRERACVVFDGNQQVVAFLGLAEHFPESWGIDAMAVRRELHHGGIGRRLVGEAIKLAKEGGATWLHVKTRTPSTADEHDGRTRRFFEAVGFAPLYESLTEWGPDDAALILVMSLSEGTTHG